MRPSSTFVSAALITFVALATAACSTTTAASTSSTTPSGSTAPKVITVPVDTAYTTPSTVGMRYRGLPSSASIDTGAVTIKTFQVAVGRTAVISGTTFRAPSGEKLVADQLQLVPDGTNGELSGLTSPPPPVGSLVVNGLTERVINLNTTLANLQSAPTMVTIVAAVPRSDHSAWLSITQAGLAQTISLLTGARGAQDPPVLYRNSSAGLSGSYTLPYTMAGPYVLPGGTSTTITITGARLSWFPVGTGNAVPTPTNTEHAWLTLDGSTTWSDSLNNPTMTSLNAPLVLPNGTSIPATMLASGSSSGALFGDVIGWEVPSSFTKGVITVSPGNNIPSVYTGSTDNFGTANAVIPVSIPASAGSAG